jgi:hypothetical protein
MDDRGLYLVELERYAIITLKWWNHEKGLNIPRHHFHSALNYLQNLDKTDSLWLPENASTPWNLRIMEIMLGILTYLDQAYHENLCDPMLRRKDADGQDITEYPFSDVRTSACSAHSLITNDRSCRATPPSFSSSTKKIKEATLLLSSK